MPRGRRTGRIPDFTWERLEEFNNRESDYLKFSIRIDGDYKWGSGWTREQELIFYTHLQGQLGLTEESREAFKNLRFEDEKAEDGCPRLVGKKTSDKTNVYLHPMEFSGYAKRSVIDQLLVVLERMKFLDVVEHYDLVDTKTVSAMTNLDYRKLLIANTKNILRWQDAMREAGYSDYDLGDKFTMAFRIPRVGDGSAMSSMDVDWSFVDTLAQVRGPIEEHEREKEAGEEREDR